MKLAKLIFFPSPQVSMPSPWRLAATTLGLAGVCAYNMREKKVSAKTTTNPSQKVTNAIYTARQIINNVQVKRLIKCCRSFYKFFFSEFLVISWNFCLRVSRRQKCLGRR
jgi:hypothetical protein